MRRLENQRQSLGLRKRALAQDLMSSTSGAPGSPVVLGPSTEFSSDQGDDRWLSRGLSACLSTRQFRTWFATFPTAASASGSCPDANWRSPELVAKGFSNKEVAQFLEISHWTVAAHLKATFLKLAVRRRSELAYIMRQLSRRPDRAAAPPEGSRAAPQRRSGPWRPLACRGAMPRLRGHHRQAVEPQT